MLPFNSSEVLFCLLEPELVNKKREGEGPEERTPATRRARERRQMAELQNVTDVADNLR